MSKGIRENFKCIHGFKCICINCYNDSCNTLLYYKDVRNGICYGQYPDGQDDSYDYMCDKFIDDDRWVMKNWAGYTRCETNIDWIKMCLKK